MELSEESQAEENVESLNQLSEKKKKTLLQKFFVRPQKRELIEKNILKDTNASALLQNTQAKLEREQKKDLLATKLAARPDIEILQCREILPVENHHPKINLSKDAKSNTFWTKIKKPNPSSVKTVEFEALNKDLQRDIKKRSISCGDLTDYIPDLAKEEITDPQFGLSPKELFQKYPISKKGDPTIPVLVATVEYLKNFINEEGLFRIPGKVKDINALKIEFERGIFNLPINDPHAVAGFLKLFMRSFREPILTSKISQLLLKLPSTLTPEQRVEQMKPIIKELPLYNFSILRYFFQFLHKVSQNHRSNKMNSKNLGRVFGSSLLESEVVGMDQLLQLDSQCIIIETLIEDAPVFFPYDEESSKPIAKGNSVSTISKNSSPNQTPKSNSPQVSHINRTNSNSKSTFPSATARTAVSSINSQKKNSFRQEETPTNITTGPASYIQRKHLNQQEETPTSNATTNNNQNNSDLANNSTTDINLVHKSRIRSRSFTKGDILLGKMPPPPPSRIGRREIIIPRPDKRPAPLPPTSAKSPSSPSPTSTSPQNSTNQEETKLIPNNSGGPSSYSLRVKPVSRKPILVPPKNNTLISGSSSSSVSSSPPSTNNNNLPTRPPRPPPATQTKTQYELKE